MSEKTKILIAFPSSDLVSTSFVGCLLSLLVKNWSEYDFSVMNAVSSRIVLNRNAIVKEAYRRKVEYILWMDADSHFPANALKRLLAHDKDVVCATTSRRHGEDHLAACSPLENLMHGKLMRMKFIGFPFMLTKLSVFDKLERPYFAEPSRRSINVFESKDYHLGDAEEQFHATIPEDEYFCHRVREAGFDIWCDMELSMEIGHIGTKIYYIKNPVAAEQKEITLEEVHG